MILYGPPQAGKTTLVQQSLKELPDAAAETTSFVGDDLYIQSLLARHELEHLKRTVGGATTISIDEAQRIDSIGLTIELLVDHLPVTVIASGSASFELADRLSEHRVQVVARVQGQSPQGLAAGLSGGRLRGRDASQLGRIPRRRGMSGRPQDRAGLQLIDWLGLYEIPTDIKHHRVPAPGVSFQVPNLPFLSSRGDVVNDDACAH